jgi:peptidoglycan/xylan/chitin deacetylase (PgdA/CDA1 family)
MKAKQLFYGACKAAGLFRLSRLLTRNRLRLLAYHGTELVDETTFSNELFIKTSTLQRRIAMLEGGHYPVLPLGEAVERLKDGSMPAGAVAITIDDGFHSTAEAMLPLLKSARLPATLYMTTYYSDRDAPVFRLAMQYCFWRSRAERLDLSRLGFQLSGEAPLADAGRKNDTLWELINFGEQQLTEEQRNTLLRLVAFELAVDLATVLQRRSLHLMTPDELRAVAGDLDVQLHTHRHRLPEDPEAARAEIEENRKSVCKAVGGQRVHFCYPSGYWAEAFFPTLEAAGIKTATTCEVGLNDRSTHPYALKRFLDSERISDLEFEAEVSGFAELLRATRRLVKKERGTMAPNAAERKRGYPAGHGRAAQASQATVGAAQALQAAVGAAQALQAAAGAAQALQAAADAAQVSQAAAGAAQASQAAAGAAQVSQAAAGAAL